MRILFDNGAPRGLARYLKGHTVDEAGPMDGKNWQTAH